MSLLGRRCPKLPFPSGHTVFIIVIVKHLCVLDECQSFFRCAVLRLWLPSVVDIAHLTGN